MLRLKPNHLPVNDPLTLESGELEIKLQVFDTLLFLFVFFHDFVDLHLKHVVSHF